MSGKNPDKIPKQRGRKKPKDKPKRPLSAYNYFFKEERGKILKVVQAEDPEAEKVENGPDSEDYLNEEAIGRLKKEGGKVSFEEMGKLIGSRWKNIDPDRLARYSEMASVDTERYKKEMQLYNGRQEAKMRNEALKPQAPFQHGGPGGPPDVPPGVDPRSQGYPPEMQGMNSAFGYPPQYGYGMEFPGYGMGMYGPYGGYPPMSMSGSPREMGVPPGENPYAQYGQHMGMMGYGEGGYGPPQYPPDQYGPPGGQGYGGGPGWGP